MKAFTVMGRVIKAAYEELFLCVYMSMIFWAGQALTVTAAPTMVGINHVFNRVANYRRVDNSFFWDGAKTQFGRGWILYVAVLGVPVAILFNIWFYANSGGLLRAVAMVWIWAFILSLMIGQYIFPLFWQQDDHDIKLVLRNAALLAFRHPLYSLLMVIFNILLFTISTVLTLPLFLLAPALLAISANFALVGLLQDMGLADEPPEIPRR